MPELSVVAQGLSYRYPQATALAVQDLEFAIPVGELVVLAGASGSGKSTLCRLLNGLIPHLYGGTVTGHLTVVGLDPCRVSPQALNQYVGLLLQRPEAQCLATTVARDIAFGPACHGWERSLIAERVQAAVDCLQISHLLQRAPQTLSCGEQQRVALAGILALRPKVVILDEPFAFLDAAGTARLRQVLQHLRDTGITLIVVEHHLDAVRDLADRMLVLHQGRLVADGPPSKVLAGGHGLWDSKETPVSFADCSIVQPEAKMSDQPLIEWDTVYCQRAGRWVLRGAALAVKAGEKVVVLGANGAGKSTLLRHGNGLLRPLRGEVRLLGNPTGSRHVAELAGTVGLVMQQPAHMLFAPTVQEELTLGPRALGCYDPAWCAQLSERFGLTALLHRFPHTLSAGEQRRLALAAVLAVRPRVLLLDEPTAGQDAHARTTLRILLQECAAEGTALVIATHDVQWAATFCSRYVILAEGVIHESLPSNLRPSFQLGVDPAVCGGEAKVGITQAETVAQNTPSFRHPYFDPRAQLVIYLLYCLLVLLALHPQHLILLLAIPLGGIILGRHETDCGRVVRLLTPTLLLFVLIVGLSSGLMAAAGAVLRLLALVAASILFFAHTPPEELGEALLKSGLSPALTFLLEGTLRFTPTMAMLARDVREAHESRGRRLRGIQGLRHGPALLGPLLSGVLRFADELAEALEIRGFGGPTRTCLTDYQLRVRDWGLMLGGAIVAAGMAAVLL